VPARPASAGRKSKVGHEGPLEVHVGLGAALDAGDLERLRQVALEGPERSSERPFPRAPRPANGGQPTAGSGRRQRTAGGGRRAADGGRRTAGGGRQVAGSSRHPAHPPRLGNSAQKPSDLKHLQPPCVSPGRTVGGRQGGLRATLRHCGHVADRPGGRRP
jgi:hypothetical protein